MDTPKVSIIVPVFNVKTYLRECLDSILNQTLSEIEIICGDGGSNDGSLEIVQEYTQKDPRVKYITKEKSGYGQSVNECIDIAKGEYIGIVESDDAIEPDTYHTLYEIAHKNNLDWIRGDIYYYYSGMPEGQQLKRESIIYEGDFYNVVLNPQTDYRPYKSGLRTWSGIYKREFLNENHIRHNETPGGSYQDVGFYLKTLYYATRVYFVNQAFYKWRQDNPGSSVHYNSSKLVEKSLKEWKLNQEYLEENPELGLRARASYNYRKFFSYLWTIDMADGEDKKKVQKLAAKEFTDALNKGEIDKGFFEEWEWERFIEQLHKWQQLEDNVIVMQPLDQNKNILRSPKQLVKKVLRPIVSLIRKINYKLMGNVVFSLENDINSLKQRVNETAEDTQWQVRESAAELCKTLKELLNISTQLNAQLEMAKMVRDDLQSMICIQKSMFETSQTLSEKLDNNVDTQTNILNFKNDFAYINDIVSTIKTKTLDHVDLLWKIQSRTEDIHDTASELKTKTLDHGDLLWSMRDKLKDIDAFQRESRDSILWNMLFEFKRQDIQQLVGTSPLYDSAFYCNNRYGSIRSAQRILSEIFKTVEHESVVDFGCGTGTWLWVAKALGAEKILGIDGDYVPKSLLLIPEFSFKAADLEKPLEFRERYDLAMSLEVAEHLHESAADTFVDSLCASADVILFSAAHLNQGGDGHINEQPREYWIDKFARRDFELEEIKQKFNHDDKIEIWYRDNIMLFRRKNK